MVLSHVEFEGCVCLIGSSVSTVQATQRGALEEQPFDHPLPHFLLKHSFSQGSAREPTLKTRASRPCAFIGLANRLQVPRIFFEKGAPPAQAWLLQRPRDALLLASPAIFWTKVVLLPARGYLGGGF